jgi:hypothetical protein
MTPDVFTLLLFLLGLFFLLVLIALNIDLIANYLTKNEIADTPQYYTFKERIENISNEINSYQLSDEMATKLISICPVEAISLLNIAEFQLKISDIKCLDYGCLRCIQLLYSEKNGLVD